MREAYPLTQQTLKALSSTEVTKIADEADIDPSHIYQIRGNYEPDPYGKFRRLYAAVIRAGGETSSWDADLSAIKAKYRKCKKTIFECLSDKLRVDTDTTDAIITALNDGKVDEREEAIIRNYIEKERDNLSMLETVIGIKGK
jgi:hypothetical protein